MTADDESSLFDRATFTGAYEDRNAYSHGPYNARVEFPEDDDFEPIEHSAHNAETAYKELVPAVGYLENYGAVNADPDDRRLRAVAAIEHAPGVVEVNASPSSRYVTVTHDTLHTGVYEGVKVLGGLEEVAWWLGVHREAGLVLTIEYEVQPFAPAPEDIEELWEEVTEKVREKEEGSILNSMSLAFLVQRVNELHEYDDRAVIEGPLVAFGEKTHRLAGTESTAEHAYYMVKVRGGDPDAVADKMYTDLTEEDVAFLADWAEEHIEERAKAYARKNAAVGVQEEEVPLEDIKPWDFVPDRSSYVPLS